MAEALGVRAWVVVGVAAEAVGVVASRPWGAQGAFGVVVKLEASWGPEVGRVKAGRLEWSPGSPSTGMQRAWTDCVAEP